jgi:hypothetical protein
MELLAVKTVNLSGRDDVFGEKISIKRRCEGASAGRSPGRVGHSISCIYSIFSKYQMDSLQFFYDSISG